MPWGEMTITLHDVYFILGLKIIGDQMAHSERDKRVRGSRSVTQLLVKKAKKMFKIPGRDISQARVTVQYLIQHIQSLNLDDTDHAGAYTMYLLASTLFPDKSQSKLPLSYVQFATNMDDNTFDISWGSGALAFMYRSLGECTRSGCKHASFCYTLLEAWIYLHFPSFRPADDINWDPQLPYPYARRWHSTNKAVYNRNYRGEIDNMQVHEVIFTLYGDLDFTLPDLAPSLFHGVLIFLDKTDPYMPDRVARQFGRTQQIPKSIIAPLRAWRRSKITTYAVEYDNAKWNWDGRQIHRFSLRHLGPKVRHAFETDPHYMAWYTPRTHPPITSPYTGAVQCIGNVHGRLSPYRYAQEDSFHAMHEAVIY